MNKIKLFISLFALIVVFGAAKSYAQSSPVLYFCESYGSNGEVSISDRFHTGYLTVMVKSDKALGLTDCTIQFDKMNCSSGTFSFYKKFNYVIKSNMKYVYFERNSDSDMAFNDPGIYRVFLLDAAGNTVTSGLIEIIP
jgi:hypothetical protein